MAVAVSDDQRILLRLLSNALFREELPKTLGDPVGLWREANQQAVALLAFANVDISCEPEDLQREIRFACKKSLAANLQIARGHIDLSRMLEDAGIRHVMIKGLVSALHYPSPELRKLGDVDFYVDPSDVEKTEAFLKENGFEALKVSHGFHHVFAKDFCRFELHFGLPGVPEGERGEVCKALFRDLLSRSTVVPTAFGPMRIPCAFHQGLITVLHMAHHLTNSGFGLRHLCDWAVFSARYSDDGFCEEFSSALKSVGLWRFACCLNDLCARYLGAPEKIKSVYYDKTLAEGLIGDIFDAGNFGQKDVVRSREAYMITSGEDVGRSKKMVRLLKDMVYQKWPASRRNPILVPLGFGYFGAEYLLRSAAGRRPKLHAREAVRGAKSRTALYDRLELYEFEKEQP
ncbi:MAG: nucleotidyltransferase family protein [Clostridia bacterium]|nr:nucleotidyltransferase family protein [Clostridia bacterium]